MSLPSIYLPIHQMYHSIHSSKMAINSHINPIFSVVLFSVRYTKITKQLKLKLYMDEGYSGIVQFNAIGFRQNVLIALFWMGSTLHAKKLLLNGATAL